jgi:hypothetical protein
LILPVSLAVCGNPPAFLFNVVFGAEPAQDLCNYWAIKARKMLEVLDAGTTALTVPGTEQLLKRCLLFACALVKAEGWRARRGGVPVDLPAEFR